MSDKTYALITIDAEPSTFKNRPLPIDKMVYGRFGADEYGISKIMDVCEKYGFKATFFVDVCPSIHYGDDEFRDICRSIHRRGHDVELHTHPNWTRGKYWMFEYSLEEQTEIIKEGLDLIHRWTGERPVAYRAGGFSADLNTIKALSKNGVAIDSSFYPGYKRCPLTSPPMEINKVSEHEGVVEIPVTVFTPLKFGQFRTHRYIDIDACTWSELKHSISECKTNGVRLVTLMLHSFSFIRWNEDRTEFSPDVGDVEQFDRTLRLFRDEGIEVITMRDFNRLYLENPGQFTGSGFIPNTGLGRTFLRSCGRFNRGWKNKAMVMSVGTFALALVYSIIKTLFQ